METETVILYAAIIVLNLTFGLAMYKLTKYYYMKRLDIEMKKVEIESKKLEFRMGQK